MPRKLLLTLIGWAVILTGCSTVRVSQDYEPATDFSGLQTYQWLSTAAPQTGDVRVDNPLLDSRFRAAIDRNLTHQGFRKTNDEPDFYIKYEYRIRQKIQTDNVGTSVGFGIGSYGRYGGVGVGTGSDVRSYDEGLVVVDLLAPDKEKLLWRGTATFRVPEHSDPEKSTEKVNEVIDKTMAQFPPTDA